MSITNTACRMGYTGNGARVDFPTTFRFLAEEHLVVEVAPAGGAFVTKTLDVDYTVTGANADAGGTVTFNAAPANLSTVRITRSTPRTQESTFRNNGQSAFSPSLYEKALDKLTMIAQEDDFRLDTLESLQTLLNVAASANAVAVDVNFLGDDPVESGFPIVVAVANGLNARQLGLRVEDAGDDQDLSTRAPAGNWRPGPGANEITLLYVSELEAANAYTFHLMVLF